MKLEQSDIIRHLELALAGDDEHLRSCVSKLVGVLTQRRVKQPGMPSLPIKWEHGKEGSLEFWDVTLHRKDAKTVEEVFADYRVRKSIPGTWKTYSVNGRLIPLRKQGPLITFRFVEVRTVVDRRKKKVAKEHEQKEKAKQSLLDQFASMNDEQRKKLLDVLYNKLK